MTDFRNSLIKEVEFTCNPSKEFLDWMKAKSKELEDASKRIENIYKQLSDEIASSHLNILESSENKEEYLASLIQTALCKGWNDCFEYNVKHKPIF